MPLAGSPLLRHQALQIKCAASFGKRVATISRLAGPKHAALVSTCSLACGQRRAGAPAGALRLAPCRRSTRGRQLVVRSVAMVNVDFASPSLLLGTALIGTGVLLLNMRNFQYKVSRDADIVVAAMVSIVGSTLIFQGWRLDPLLLLCQALTTSVAFWYGLETFRLRSKEADMAPPQLPPGVGSDPMSLDVQQQAAQQYYQQQMGFPPGGAPFLPPGAETPYYPWGSAGASSSGQADPQSPYGMGYGSPYGETIQYDYYGNPILPTQPPQQQQQQQQPEMAGYDGAASTSGMPYGAGTPVPPVYGAAGVDQAGYYGGSGVPLAGGAGPYDGQAAYGAGPGPASGMGGESWPGAGGYGTAATGSAVSGAGGYGAGPQPGAAVGPSGQGQFALPPPGSSGGGAAAPGATSGPAFGGAGLGMGAMSGTGRRPTGRLDLHEKVDDWE